MINFFKYFFGYEDSKGNHYFPSKPSALIFMVFLILTIVSLLTGCFPLSILLSAGIFAPLVNGYMDYKLYKVKNKTKKEKRELSIKKLLK